MFKNLLVLYILSSFCLRWDNGTKLLYMKDCYKFFKFIIIVIIKDVGYVGYKQTFLKLILIYN